MDSGDLSLFGFYVMPALASDFVSLICLSATTRTLVNSAGMPKERSKRLYLRRLGKDFRLTVFLSMFLGTASTICIQKKSVLFLN